MKKQFNTYIKDQLALRVKVDAVKLGVTLEDYATAAFELFLQKSIEQRRVYLCGRRKLVGRKISV